jgi:hypothetical protein
MENYLLFIVAAAFFAGILVGGEYENHRIRKGLEELPWWGEKVTHIMKGSTFAFVVALVLSVAVQAQTPICDQNGAVNSLPACSDSFSVPVWSGTLELQKNSEGKYDIGSSTFRYTNRTLASVWHENWEFHDGKLHILQPMEVVYQGTPVQLGRTVPDPDTYDVSPTTNGPRVLYAKPEFDQVIMTTQGPYLGYGETLRILQAGSDPSRTGDSPTICGKFDNYTANIDLLLISCLDFDGLRKVAPQVPWPVKPQTQVLVHVREGDAVKITVGDQVQFADLVDDAERRRVALVQFEGIGHTTKTVKVYREVQ